MAIYLKKTESGEVEAYGDLESLGGASYDKVITEAQWKAAQYKAHVVDGGITLGRSTEDLAEIVREERDHRLRVDCDSVSALRWATMSTEKREKLKAYRQALLDIPQTDGFPWDGENVPWPKKPGEEG